MSESSKEIGKLVCSPPIRAAWPHRVEIGRSDDHDALWRPVSSAGVPRVNKPPSIAIVSPLIDRAGSDAEDGGGRDFFRFNNPLHRDDAQEELASGACAMDGVCIVVPLGS